MAGESVLILRGEDNKFILFEYENGLLALPRETVLDESDSGSSILAMARHVVTRISSAFNISYLQTMNVACQSLKTSDKVELVDSSNLLAIW